VQRFAARKGCVERVEIVVVETDAVVGNPEPDDRWVLLLQEVACFTKDPDCHHAGARWELRVLDRLERVHDRLEQRQERFPLREDGLSDLSCEVDFDGHLGR